MFWNDINDSECCKTRKNIVVKAKVFNVKKMGY